MEAGEGWGADDWKGARGGDQAESKANGHHMLEAQAPTQEAAEDGAHRPERRCPERLRYRRQAVHVGLERVRQRDQPDADQRGEQKPDEATPRLFAEHEPRTDDDDQRLHLLEHDHGDEVPMEEGLREQDRRERRGAGADSDAGCDIGGTGAPQRDHRRDEQRQRHEDEHDVLAEDDGVGGGRVGEGLADQAVQAPHRRGDADEDDSGDAAETLRHRAEPSRADPARR